MTDGHAANQGSDWKDGTQVAGGEKYGVQFPSSNFDTHVLPTFETTGSMVGSGPGASYTTAPTAVLFGLYLVLRQVTTVTANALDCDADGGDCFTVQAAFVDATQLVFSPSGNTSFASLRVASGDATCVTVRQSCLSRAGLVL